MKTGFSVLLALTWGAAMLAAQNGNPQSGSKFELNAIAQPPLSHNCPVSMRAQHLSDGSPVKTSNAPHPAGIGQRLHLTFTNPDLKQIASASVTIHGMTPKGLVMQAAFAQGGSSDATQSLSVTFSAGPDRSATANLWIPGMTAVQSIELESMMYSDGSTWKPADGIACHVTPDPLMLITSR